MATLYHTSARIEAAVADCTTSPSLTLTDFGVKAAHCLRLCAMRDDLMDIDMHELETFAPARIFVPFILRTKTTKTTR